MPYIEILEMAIPTVKLQVSIKPLSPSGQFNENIFWEQNCYLSIYAVLS